MDVPQPPNLDVWRMAGAAVGAILAFLVAWPSSWRDFLTRFLLSVALGLIFGPIVREHFLQWPETARFALGSATLCSMLGWWAVAAAVRILQGMNTLPKK
jgi:predicted PurR-regulated permease PerM